MTDAPHLDDSITKLRSEIQATGPTDEPTRRRLEDLLHDMEKARAKLPGSMDAAGLGERMKASTIEFETSHPRLSVLINEALEKLGSFGI